MKLTLANQPTKLTKAYTAYLAKKYQLSVSKIEHLTRCISVELRTLYLSGYADVRERPRLGIFLAKIRDNQLNGVFSTLNTEQVFFDEDEPIVCELLTSLNVTKIAQCLH